MYLASSTEWSLRIKPVYIKMNTNETARLEQQVEAAVHQRQAGRLRRAAPGGLDARVDAPARGKAWPARGCACLMCVARV